MEFRAGIIVLACLAQALLVVTSGDDPVTFDLDAMISNATDSLNLSLVHLISVNTSIHEYYAYLSKEVQSDIEKVGHKILEFNAPEFNTTIFENMMARSKETSEELKKRHITLSEGLVRDFTRIIPLTCDRLNQRKFREISQDFERLNQTVREIFSENLNADEYDFHITEDFEFIYLTIVHEFKQCYTGLSDNQEEEIKSSINDIFNALKEKMLKGLTLIRPLMDNFRFGAQAISLILQHNIPVVTSDDDLVTHDLDAVISNATESLAIAVQHGAALNESIVGLYQYLITDAELEFVKVADRLLELQAPMFNSSMKEILKEEYERSCDSFHMLNVNPLQTYYNAFKASATNLTIFLQQRRYQEINQEWLTYYFTSVATMQFQLGYEVIKEPGLKRKNGFIDAGLFVRERLTNKTNEYTQGLSNENASEILTSVQKILDAIQAKGDESLEQMDLFFHHADLAYSKIVQIFTKVNTID